MDPRLRTKGWRRRGTTYYKRVDGNWSVIEFQRHPRSGPGEIEFVVELGIASAALPPLPTPGSKAPPLPGVCHLGWRLGEDPSGAGERWWSIDTAASVDAHERLAQDIVEALERRDLDALEAALTNDGLLAYLERQGSRHGWVLSSYYAAILRGESPPPPAWPRTRTPDGLDRAMEAVDAYLGEPPRPFPARR